MRPLPLRLLALVLLAAPLAAPHCAPELPERVFLRDAQGRALVLHGVNVSGSAKGDPERLPWVGPADVARLSAEWGFNFARYLILWDALEPAPGRIDADYLDAVAERLDWFHDAGILVVLDMHQDVYSRVFCCDGAPEWAIDDEGLPFTRSPIWWANYLQPAVMRAFDNFFDTSRDHPGLDRHLQDHYADVWKAVAARLGDHPAVLGYDPMNEPHPGSAFTGTPEDLAAFDRERLQPFYERVTAAIREVDTESWIFYEPHYGLPSAGFPSYLGVPADPRPGGPRMAYFPHLYSIRLEGGGGYDPQADETLPNWEAERARELRTHRVPMLIGEFGVQDGIANGERYLAEALALADRLGSGWAYWEYNDDSYGFLNPDGSEKPKLDLLVRPYPARVAGDPVWYGYDPDRRAFALIFRDRPGVTGPTEIRVPERHYPDGFEVGASGAPGAWTAVWDAGRQVLEFTPDPAETRHAVWIAPAGAP